jgi:hypothetical protein
MSIPCISVWNMSNSCTLTVFFIYLWASLLLHHPCGVLFKFWTNSMYWFTLPLNKTAIININCCVLCSSNLFIKLPLPPLRIVATVHMYCLEEQRKYENVCCLFRWAADRISCYEAIHFTAIHCSALYFVQYHHAEKCFKRKFVDYWRCSVLHSCPIYFRLLSVGLFCSAEACKVWCGLL